jgi:hypothetical protein
MKKKPMEKGKGEKKVDKKIKWKNKKKETLLKKKCCNSIIINVLLHWFNGILAYIIPEYVHGIEHHYNIETMIDNNKNNNMKSWKLIKGIFNPNLFLVFQLPMI